MRRFALVAIAALFLVGCTTSPPTPSTTVNAQQVIYSVITEIYCAAIAPELQYPLTDLETVDSSSQPAPSSNISYFASADNWVMGVDLYLSASVEASVSPSLSLLGPFNLAKAVPPVGGTTGSFTSAFGASFDQTRTNLREYKLYIFMPALILGAESYQSPYAKNWGDLTGVNCATSSGGAYDKISSKTYLVGRLGVKDWLVPAVLAQEDTHIYSPIPTKSQSVTDGVSQNNQQGGGGSAQNPTIATTITFTIKATGTVGPSFALTRVSGGSNTLFSATRTDNNYVNIAFTPATYCWTKPQVSLDNSSPPTATIDCPSPDTALAQAASALNVQANEARRRAPLKGAQRGAPVETPELKALNKRIAAIASIRKRIVTQTKISTVRSFPTQQDIGAATERIDNALFNLNLAHAISP